MSGLSAGDRKLLEESCNAWGEGEPCFLCRRNQRILALIVQQEKALEAADRLSEAVSKFSALSGMFDPEKSRAAYANDHYRSARAATEGEG